MKFTTKNILLAAALAGATLAAAGQANAMTVAPLAGVAQNAEITHVGWRCGPRHHMNRWHRCVWNGRR